MPFSTEMGAAIRRACLAVAALMCAFDVVAARFPDAIQREIRFVGTDAAEVRELLGLPDDLVEVSYPLHPLEIHAAGISAGTDARGRAEDNVAVADDEGGLVLSGPFLDRDTGSGQSGPHHRFGSPLIDAGYAEDDGWRRIVSKWSGRFVHATDLGDACRITARPGEVFSHVWRGGDGTVVSLTVFEQAGKPDPQRRLYKIEIGIDRVDHGDPASLRGGGRRSAGFW
jgi:hypothetical protein